MVKRFSIAEYSAKPIYARIKTDDYNSGNEKTAIKCRPTLAASFFTAIACHRHHTLGCIYFGAWEITKTWVVDDLLSDRGLHCESPVPFVVVFDEIDYVNNQYMRRYHFCCLALMVRLPYAHECHDRQPLIMGGVIPRIIIQEEEEDRLGVASP